ncbi:MAG: hypothetical protein ACFE8N_15570 [Promethearchaeota archaeon]
MVRDICILIKNTSFIDAIVAGNGITHLELLRKRSVGNAINPFHLKFLQSSLRSVHQKEQLL